MALEKQVVPIPFSGGLNRKPDQLQLNPPYLSAVVNGTFSTPGRLQKRNGYAAVSDRIIGTTDTIGTGYALAQYQDELLAFDQNSAYSYAADANRWVDKGNVVSTLVTKKAVDAASSQVDFQMDGATHPGGLQCYVFTRARSFDSAAELDVWMTLIDSTSGQTIRQPEVISTRSQRARVVVRAGQFVIFVNDYNDDTLRVATLSVSNPTATVTFTTIAGAAAGDQSISTSRPFFDVIVADSTTGGDNALYLVFNNDDPSGGVTLWYYQSGAAWVPAPTATVSLSGTDGRACTVFFDPFNSGPVIAYADAATVNFAQYTGDLLTSIYAGTLDAAANVRAITGCALSSTDLDLRIFWDRGLTTTPAYVASITANYSLSVLGMVLGGAILSFNVSAPVALLYSVRLASKAWGRDGVPFVAMTHLSDLQPTYFVVNGDTGAVAVRALRGTGFLPTVGTAGVALTQSRSLPSVSTVGDDSFRFAVGEITGLPPDAGAITSVFIATDIDDVTPVGVSALTVEFFDAEKVYQSAEIGGALHLSGGSMSAYDGENFVEDGFHLYPEGLTVSGLSAGSTTSYGYIGVYEWTDNNNNLYRSAPSVPVIATSSAAISGANDASIVFPTLRVTDKTPANGRGNVMLALYRTEDAASGGSVYYRLPYTITNINDVSVNSVTLTDATEDADLVDGIRLYTDGGVIENVPPPPVGAVCAHGNRLFVLDSTNPLSIAYSKEVEPGVGVEFGEGFVVNVNPKGGIVTGLASMDDKLIVFKENSVYAMTGSGPDVLGDNDDYSTPVFVTGDAGCINTRSIVTTPDGLMFQSRKGIKLLTRALEMVDVGAPVSGLDVSPVTSAVLMTDVDQVRFTLEDGTTLMFDYFVKQWSQFTGIAAVDSVMWQDLHVYLRSDGTVLKETPNVYTDDGSHIPLLVRTAWIKVAGLQGFQRLWKFLILGTYESPHSLQVSIAHDFNPTPTQVTTADPTAPSVFGADATFGDSDVFGGEFPLYQWRVNMTRQASQAVQITIQDVQGSDAGQGMTLSGITLEIGVKKGANKVGAANSIGP